MSKQFAVAEGVRQQLTVQQQNKITALYKSVIESINERMKFIEMQDKRNISSILRQQYLGELTQEIKDNMQVVDSQTENLIKQNMLLASQSVVKSNGVMLSEMGFSDLVSKTAFSYVPQDVVTQLASGTLYEGKWSLSKAIWNDNAVKDKELDYIVAQGVAMNKSTYEIAKDLEKYVNPSARKAWDWSKVYPNTRKVIDYNAQRLARTMVSHAYQESFVRTTKSNPFVEAYKWEISNSDRVCPLCISRAEDDNFGLGAGVFPKDQLPLDHPNGMCTFTTIIPNSYDEIADKLADWVKGEGDETLNNKIDNFVEDMGIKVSKPNTDNKTATANVDKKDIFGTDEWYENKFKKVTKGMSEEQKQEFMRALKTAPENYQKVLGEVASKRSLKIKRSDEQYYAVLEKALYVDANKMYKQGISCNFENKMSTMFHEMGHAIDNNKVNKVWDLDKAYSSQSKFSKAFEKDVKVIVKQFNANHALFKQKYSQILLDEDSRNVQDVFSGLKAAESIGKVELPFFDELRTVWNHREKYWTGEHGENDVQKQIQCELFAEISSSQTSKREMKYIKEYFPNSVQAFDEIIDKLASKVK
jgi:hypothetical protein